MQACTSSSCTALRAVTFGTRYPLESCHCKYLPLAAPTAVRDNWVSQRRSVFDISCATVRDFQSSDYEMLSALDEPGQGQPRRRLPEAALASLPSHVHPGPLPPAVAGPPLLCAAGLPCSSRWSGLACISPSTPRPRYCLSQGPRYGALQVYPAVSGLSLSGTVPSRLLVCVVSSAAAEVRAVVQLYMLL